MAENHTSSGEQNQSSPKKSFVENGDANQEQSPIDQIEQDQSFLEYVSSRVERALAEAKEGDDAKNIRLSAFEAFADTPPPPIEFVIDKILERGAISILFGRPNAGKSTIAAAEIVSIAAGKDLANIGLKPKTGKVVVYWADEGGPSAFQRKAMALCARHKLEWPAIRQNLRWIDGGLTVTPDNCAEIVRQIAEQCGQFKPDAIYIDSLSSLAPGLEMTNDIAAKIMKALEWLAKAQNLGIRIIAHPRKGDPTGKTVRNSFDELRGASAIAGRAAIVEQVILEIDSQTGERIAKIAGSDLKYRNSPALPRAYALTPYQIDHDRPELYPPMIALAAKLPDEFDKLHLTTADCKRLHALVLGAPKEERLVNMQANNWAGYIIAKDLLIDYDDKDQLKAINGILKSWKRASKLRIGTAKYTNEKREKKTSECYIAGGKNFNE